MEPLNNKSILKTSSSIYELFERIRIKNNVYDDEINKSMVISYFLEHSDYFKVIRCSGFYNMVMFTGASKYMRIVIS